MEMDLYVYKYEKYGDVPFQLKLGIVDGRVEFLNLDYTVERLTIPVQRLDREEYNEWYFDAVYNLAKKMSEVLREVDFEKEGVFLYMNY